MEKFVSVTYGFLARILAMVAGIPQGLEKGGDVMAAVVAVLLLIASLAVFFVAMRMNQDDYTFWIRMAVGGVLIFYITYFAVIENGQLSVDIIRPWYRAALLAALLVCAIVFAVVNFMLSSDQDPKGKVLATLWGAEFLFAAGTLRAWTLIKSTDTPQYGKIMILSRFVKSVITEVKAAGFETLFHLIETVILIALLFFTIFCLFRTQRFMEDEWKIGIASQFMVIISYLLYESHSGFDWRMDHAFMVFLLFTAGSILYVFVFCFELCQKNQDGCVGAFFMGLCGITGSISVILSVDMAQQGAMSTCINMISDVMTWMYNLMPQGMNLSGELEGAVTAILNMSVAIVLTLILVIILFIFLDKVLEFDEVGAENMSRSWYRNSTLLVLVPLVVFWMVGMQGSSWGGGYQWVQVMLCSMTIMGLAGCISNIAPCLADRFMEQLKLIAVSLIASLTAVGVILPMLVALIL